MLIVWVERLIAESVEAAVAMRSCLLRLGIDETAGLVHGDDRIVVLNDKEIVGVERKRHWLLLLSMLGADSIDDGLL